MFLKDHGGIHFNCIFSTILNISCVSRLKTCNYPEESTFPTPGWTYNTDEISIIDLKTDIVQSNNIFIV